MTQDLPVILVVDDYEPNRDLLARRLGARGYDAVCVDSGAAALDCIENRGSVDLILLDLMMPEMDGFTVLQRLRTQFSVAELPAIIITARDDSDSVVEGLSYGANDFITKPIDFPVLMARMETQLARAAAERKWRELSQTLEAKVADRTREIERASEALRESEERYRALYENNPAIFMTVNPVDGRIISANRYGAQILGFEPNELIGRDFADLHVEDAQSAVAAFLKECANQRDAVVSKEFPKQRRDGQLIWTRDTARGMADTANREVVLIVCADISSEYRLSEKLAHQVHHDGLTGLANRAEFDRQLDDSVGGCRRTGASHVLCYLDIKHFRIVNDTLGHSAGDEILKGVADLASTQIRQGDVIARLGGDEFGLLLRYCTVPRAVQVMERINETIRSHSFRVAHEEVHVDVAIGLASIDRESLGSAFDVLNNAHAACDLAKEQVNGKIHIFEEDDQVLTRRRGEMRWVSRLRRALASDQLRLFAQAIQPMTPAQVTPTEQHYEVLVRLLDDDNRLLSPGLFLPAAERYGLAGAIDEWVVTNTFEWLARNPQHLSNMKHCGINLSGYSLTDEMAEFVERAFTEFQIPAEKICFEVTETAAIESLAAGKRFMDTLRQYGSKFALDDFGSGMASFGYLGTLDVDYIKIDGQFVKDLHENPVHKAIVNSIHEIAGTLGMRTIAEFVESAEIHAALKTIGVDYAQGYWLGKPRPLTELSDTETVREDVA